MVRDRVRLATPESSESDSGSSQAGVGGGDGAGVARANFTISAKLFLMAASVGPWTLFLPV